MPDAVLVYRGGMHCDGTHGPSQSVVAIDVPPANGGTGEGFSPFDLLSMAVGS